MVLLKRLLNIFSLLPKIVVCVLAIMLSACQSPQTLAPVVNGWSQPAGQRDYHTVKKGESLYAIAWMYGYDYRDLARINHIAAPYSIKIGEKIVFLPKKDRQKVVKPKKGAIVSKHSVMHKIEKSPKHREPKTTKMVNTGKGTWVWPTKGKVSQAFVGGMSQSKGIDVAGKLNQPVVASREGIIVYSGHGLVGYGNLIIIKHNGNYLSAYAYNDKNLVKEGELVKSGQKIAMMGKTHSKQGLLHFEIRKNGKPVDPSALLP